MVKKTERTIVLVHFLVVSIFAMTKVVPLGCTHSDFEVFVLIWARRRLQSNELIHIERLGALEFPLFLG